MKGLILWRNIKLKISLLLAVLSFCAINTNCSAVNVDDIEEVSNREYNNTNNLSKYNIKYSNISIDMINKLKELANKEYNDTNTLSDICDIFIAKLTQFDKHNSFLFQYHPIFSIINRNRNFVVRPSALLALCFDPIVAAAFCGISIFGSEIIRNVHRDEYKYNEFETYSEFINEYNEFANAVSRFINTNHVNDITANKNLLIKWNSSSEFRNTFGVTTREILKLFSNKNMITSVQNIKQYTQIKPIFEKYLLEFIDQIEGIDENDIYNDYARKMHEKYNVFVKEMYKQINTLNDNNLTDEELQKVWGIVLFQHIHKLNEKLDKFKQAYTKNDYTLKNFYDIFPIVDLTAIKQYAEKNL